jgi:predicted ATPase
MRLEASAQALTLLEDYLEDKHLLLILDNCEHLVEACARLADALLKACPHLRILASSREALGIEGEAPYRVPPLAFPRADEPVENLGQYEAVRLFLERAGTASPDLQLTPENASAVAKICQQLDGIPLAIELAAARVKVLRVEEIAQRLDDRLRLLMGGSRAALQRYQTLRASIDWSYDLLSPAEQRLLRRLSVFAGGWMLEAAEYVGCGEGIETCEVLDLLSQLVNKSLVVVEAGGTETRYRMLETIRQYAQEKLAEMGEEEKIRDRHLVYYVELAERVEGKIRGPDMVVILNRLEADLDNIRLGLAWSLDRNHQELGLRITSALLHFWHLCGHHIDAWDWFSRLRFLESEECAFKFTSSVSTLVQARALYVISLLAFHLGKSNLAIEMAKKSLILFQDFGVDGKQGYAYALTSIASTYTYFRDEETARTQLERSLAIFNKIGDKFGASECLHVLGENADIRRQFEQAKSYFNETLRISMQIGDKVNTVYALFLLGILAFHMGDPKKSRFYFEESLQIHPDINKFSGFSTPCYLAQLDWMEGNYSKAIQLINETLLIGYRQQNVISISFCLVLLGNIELSQGHYDKAIQWYDEKRNHDQKYDLPGEMAQNWYIFGKLAWAKGDEKSAEKYFSEALMLSHEIGDKFLDGVSLLYLGKVKIAQGEYDQSRVDLINSLLHQKENQEPHVIMYCIEAIAFLMAVDQLVEQSVRLLGATDDWCDLTKLWRTPRERQERESTIAFLGKALGEEAFAKAWEEGKTMTLEQAIAYAKEVGNG